MGTKITDTTHFNILYEIEIWKEIPGYSDYLASNTGFIKNANYGNILRSGSKNKYGHQICTLFVNYKAVKNLSVHKLILLAFIGECPWGKQSRHLDSNPRNNNLRNLLYGAHSENTNDRISNNTNLPGERNGNSVFKESDILKIRELYPALKSQRKTAKVFNTSQSQIKDIVNRKTWKHI